MVKVKKIQLKDLQSFVNSKMYLSLVDKPISLLRVQSYINNPNANENDYVLYMAFIKDDLVGYRTIFTDIFFHNDKHKPIKFGWLSGNWVHNRFRRKGVSSILFKEVLNDWDGKLMYTNYAEASKAVYDKTKEFAVLKSLKGYRYYRRVCFAILLPPKARFFKVIKPVLIFLDWISNLFLDIRFLLQKDMKSTYKIKKIELWNDEIISFLSNFKEQELFQRNSEAYKWIQKYPWIKSDVQTNKNSKSYYFSSYAKKYNSHFYQVNHSKTNKIVAILNISIKDRQLKIPYLYIFPEALEFTKEFILKNCKNHKINYLTIYNTSLNNILKNGKNPFLTHKMFEQKYFVTKTILNEFKEIQQAEIQTGDGDGVFT
jgi:hypothetical protein